MSYNLVLYLQALSLIDEIFDEMAGLTKSHLSINEKTSHHVDWYVEGSYAGRLSKILGKRPVSSDVGLRVFAYAEPPLTISVNTMLDLNLVHKPGNVQNTIMCFIPWINQTTYDFILDDSDDATYMLRFQGKLMLKNPKDKVLWDEILPLITIDYTWVNDFVHQAY